MTGKTIQVTSNHFTHNDEGGKTATISMNSRRMLGLNNNKPAIIADLQKMHEVHPDCSDIQIAVCIDGTCRDAMGIPLKASPEDPDAYLHTPGDAIDLLNKFA